MAFRDDITADLTDAQVFALAEREPGRFGLLFDRHYDVIFGYLARRLGRTTAEEIASETFVQAFAHRDRFDRAAHESARPWLFGIAVRLALRHRRSEVRQLRAYARVGTDSLSLDTSHESDARLDAAADAARLAGALADLPDGDREALELFAWGALSYPEIAEALEIPVGTVRSRLNRARRTLVDRYAAHGGERHVTVGAALGMTPREDAA